KAQALAQRLKHVAERVDAASTIREAVSHADIVSAATLATAPLILGSDLPDGIHVDLVGGFRPDMREADDETMRRAGRIFIDTREGAMTEAGDILQPLQAGLPTEADIAGDLFDLVRGKTEGRQNQSQITVFKSVGASIEDLAAASIVYGGHQA